MEKLQIAIERARKQREATPSSPKTRKSSPAGSGQGSGAGSVRGRPGPRLLPDGLMDLWSELPEVSVPRGVADKNRLVAHMVSSVAGNYDILRTKVMIELRKNGWRRVAITSPTGRCGKTTTVSNLALSIARQGDLRTTLFDFDFRRPGVGNIFGVKPKDDLSAFLRGDTTFAENAVRIGTNLAVSTSGTPDADPTKLIAGDRVSQVLDEFEKTYAPDVMLFDLPPILATDDVRAFLRNVDCAILVARAETTTAKEIDMSEREIAEQTNVLGVVLNECRFDENNSFAEDYG